MSWDDGRQLRPVGGPRPGARRRPGYNALVLLWPDADDLPEGGEIDFMEIPKGTGRRWTYLHYGEDDEQKHGRVQTDAHPLAQLGGRVDTDSIIGYLDGVGSGTAPRTTTRPAARPHALVHSAGLVPYGTTGPVRESTMQVDWVREYDLD